MNATAHRDVRLVVPCYNEAARLSRDVFLEFVRSTPGTTLVFVDDGSTDQTAAVLDDLSACAAGRIEVRRLERNSGKAEAVRHGIRACLGSGAEIVGYWDADLSTPFTAVPRFLAIFDERPAVDIVTGARVRLLGRDVERRLLRHYVGRLFATAASMALGIPFYDTQCGAKMFRACPAVAAAFDRPFRSSWAFDVEILARYLAVVGESEADSRIYELPLEVWRDVPGSKVKLRGGVAAVRDLLRIGLARVSGRKP